MLKFLYTKPTHNALDHYSVKYEDLSNNFRNILLLCVLEQLKGKIWNRNKYVNVDVILHTIVQVQFTAKA